MQIDSIRSCPSSGALVLEKLVGSRDEACSFTLLAHILKMFECFDHDLYMRCCYLYAAVPLWLMPMQRSTQNEYLKTTNNDDVKLHNDNWSLSPDLAAVSFSGSSVNVQLEALDTAQDLQKKARVMRFWTGVLFTLNMVSIPSRQFMVYENLLKQLTGNHTMNEWGLKHVSISELDRSLLQDCVESRASFARPSSVGSETRLTTMCSDGNTKSTDDSTSVLRPNLSSEALEKSASHVELDAQNEASEQWVPVETAPTNVVDKREVCITSRELQDYSGELLGPDTSHHKTGDEEESPLVGKDLCLGQKLHTNEVVWKSIEAQGGSPIPLSKAQRISIQKELRRVAAALSGQKARLLERDPADVACAVVDVQIEERMDLHLNPNALTCHVEPCNHVVRGVFHEETSSEYSDPLGNVSHNNALGCVEREAAGNSNVSQTEDEGLDDLQATFTYKNFRTQVRVQNSKPEPLRLITTSKTDAKNQTLTVWEDPLSSNGIAHIKSKQCCTNMASVKGAKVVGNSQNIQECKTEEDIDGSRKGKRKGCEEDSLISATAEDGLASSTFPSNHMGVCFECKGSLTSTEKVDCSRNDCDRVYHLSCAVGLSDVSWSFEGKLVCPQHFWHLEGSLRSRPPINVKWTVSSSQKVCTPTCEILVGNLSEEHISVCYACGKSQGARLWRCQNCSLATHENCIPCPEVTTLFHKRPGWAICWRHASYVDYKLKTPTYDCQDIFRLLPVPDVQQEFNLTSEFIKEVMENDREPPPYFFIRRNVFLIKKKRDDADDGVGCSCKSAQDVCGDDCECRVQSMSCSKDCKCSHKCSNKPFRKDKRLKVIKTAYCGWGAFAAEAIKKDEFIIEYTGEVIDDAMCEKRLWEMKGRRSISNFYMCEIAKDFIIDATRKGNASRYLNHSCQPNCRLEKWRVDGETRVGVFAARNIAAGEELNYDYKYVEFGPNVTCRCGALNCRGAIGERFNGNRKSNNVSLPINWGSQHKRSSLTQRRRHTHF